jgi:hypothetical protein
LSRRFRDRHRLYAPKQRAYVPVGLPRLRALHETKAAGSGPPANSRGENTMKMKKFIFCLPV